LESDRMITLTPTDWTADDCFKVAIKGLCHCLKTMINLITNNVHYASIKTMLGNMGQVIAGIGVSDGQNRGVNAAKEAFANYQFEECSLKEIKKVIVSVSSYIFSLSKSEKEKIVRVIKNEVHPDATVMLRASVDPENYREICVTLICEHICKPVPPK
jgi:cell division GTPase FtsZ